MKRHISIFAFLLGAFTTAALVPSADAATSATLTISSRGYWEPGKTPNFQNLVEKPDVISPASVTKSVSYGDTIRFTAVPPKSGYAVDGWYQDDDAFMVSPDLIDGTSGKLVIDWTYTGTGTTTPNVYLGILFRYLTYNVKYDENGGSPVSDKSKISYTSSFTLAAAPSKTGYTFSGWKDINGSGKSWAAEASVKGASFSELNDVHVDNHDVILQAQWAPNTYAVSSTGENCTVSVATSAAYDGDLAINWTPDGAWVKPTVKVYSGTDDKGTLVKDYSNLSEGTMSVSFKMSERGTYYDKVFVKVSYTVHTLTFNPNGGKCDEKSRRVESGKSVGTLPIPTMHQKQYDGWWDDLAHGNQITATTKLTEDITVFARWADVTLFDIDTIAEPEEGGTLTGGGKFEKDAQTTLAATENKGYSFLKWTAKTSGAEWFNREWPITVSGGEEYTAFFTGNVYKVTFMAPEGTPIKQERFVTFGSEYGDLPTAIWTEDESDMELAGWNTDPDGEGDVVFSNTVVSIAGKQTLYAMWRPIPVYHIAYDGNGSTSGSMANQKMYCGVADNLTSNAYERIGYHFRGWATNTADAAALKVAYADGERVTDIASTNETAILYAVWDAITLGEAMHCNDPSLNWISKKYFDAMVNEWTTAFGDGIGCGSDSCVRQQPGTNLGQQQWLYADVSENGHLSFMWKPSSGTSGEISVAVISQNAMPTGKEIFTVAYASTGWQVFEIDIDVSKGHFIHIANSGTSECLIDQMSWGWPVPVDGKDNVTISSAAVSDGKFVLSFDSKAEFDYNLLTNANLLIKEGWGVMGEKKTGDGSVLTFKPEIIEGQPQLFYKVETIQRK